MVSYKKINAVLSLFTVAALVIHAVYQTVSYAVLNYNPVISKVLGYLTLIPIIFHIVLSVISVFVLHDSKTVAYGRMNSAILIQRISSVLLLCLLPIHMETFALLQAYPDSLIYILIKAAEVLFYVGLLAHVSVSISRALITLGILKKIENKRRLDRVVWGLCGLLFVAIIWYIVMFSV